MPADEFSLLKNVFGTDLHREKASTDVESFEVEVQPAEPAVVRWDEKPRDVMADLEAVTERVGHKVEVINPQLVQLTPDLIVNVRDIVRCERRPNSHTVEVRLNSERGQRVICIDDRYGAWERLERAANPTIVIHAPSSSALPPG